MSSGSLGGAARGGTVGASLATVVILVPVASRLDAYEISDPLVYMGLPLLAIATAVGALLGAVLGAIRRPAPRAGGSVGSSVPSGVFRFAAVAVVVGWLLVLARTTGVITLGG